MVGLLSLLLCALVAMHAQVYGDNRATLTILESAIPKGADGSAPAYSYVEGSGNGSDSWLVFLMGGGWCNNLTECIRRTTDHSILGSSRNITKPLNFNDGLLNVDCVSNPDFCNWHMVFIYYCDGASFMADVTHPKANLTFRGARIYNVMMDEMLAKGMGKATNAILSGTSAGGLAAMLHCDSFRALFPKTSRVKCISDSGFFIRGEGLYGEKDREGLFADVIKTHELAKSLPPICTSKRNSSLCLFPEYFAGNIQTPLFILESAFDQFQLERLVSLGYTDCTLNLSCNSTELGIFRDFRTTFINTLERVMSNSSRRGLFVHSYYFHGHFTSNPKFTCIILANKTLGQSVGDWYLDRSYVREIDTKNGSPIRFTNKYFCPPPVNHKSLASVTHNGLSFLFLFSFSFFLFSSSLI